jgi:Na+/proline symporter
VVFWLIGPHVALIVMVLYLLLLFGIAHYADHQKHSGRSIVANPHVYALSLCVYVSAWTFYGSIGKAATTGLEFLPIYLGPVFAMTIGWIVIRKMIRVSKEYRLTSISDFISYRYGSSYIIGAVVAVLSLIMVTPYVALQLIAISTSLDILSGPQLLLGFSVESKLVVALLLGAFAVTFGARHLDPMERHEGLIAVVAFESLVKIVAFFLAGIYVTYGVFDGYGNIMDGMIRLASSSEVYADLIDVEYPLWFSLTLISFFAVFFLPRQFHVMVVENSDEAHLKKAMWLFPLYLLLINIFVPAIAGAGLLLNTPGLKDAFIITIPYSQGQDWLALFVFIGGTSAATAMILVESVAVGTMLLNDLEMPYILSHIKKGRNLANTLLYARRLNILLVVLLGYLYSRAVAYQILADIGIVSFLAVSQLAPAALGGLYWKRGSREGAMAGLISGFLLWGYTALIPTIAGEDGVLRRLVQDGPFGLAFFKPTNLFGLDIDIWTNSVFWTLLVNCSLYALVSLLTKPSPADEAIAHRFVDAYHEKVLPLDHDRREIRQGTVEELEATLARYIGEARAKEEIDADLTRLGTSREKIEALQLLELWGQFEKTLTGSVGPSAARMIVEDQVTTVKPVLEATQSTLPTYDLRKGKIYVVHEKAYEVFTDQITHGVEGLCITHQSPEDVRRRWGFKETPIIKLSDEKGSDRYISPRNLPLLFMTIKSFVESSKNSIVLIDSIEQLVKENEGRVPEREMLDFVYQMELLARKTHLILAEKPECLHIKTISSGIDEVKELLFSLGPLSAYLFRAFSETMLSRLGEEARRQVTLEANELIAAQDFFEVTKEDSTGSEPIPDDASGATCEPDMRNALSSSLSLDIKPGLVLTRRGFFMAVRRLSRIINKHDPAFNLTTAVAALMKSYGRSPYEITLIPGTTYVIEEEKPRQSMEIFSELVSHGMEGLCVSRYNPEVLNERYGVPEETIIWLTQKSEPGYRTADPTNFPRLNSIISDFLERANYPLILLEGMGYLITQSNYETVLRFIQSQRDEIALKNAVMLVHIDPLSLDTKELHRLANELETFG